MILIRGTPKLTHQHQFVHFRPPTLAFNRVPDDHFHPRHRPAQPGRKSAKSLIVARCVAVSRGNVAVDDTAPRASVLPGNPPLRFLPQWYGGRLLALLQPRNPHHSRRSWRHYPRRSWRSCCFRCESTAILHC